MAARPLPIQIWLRERRRRRYRQAAILLILLAAAVWQVDRQRGDRRWERQVWPIARVIDERTVEIMTPRGPWQVGIVGIEMLDFQTQPAEDWLVEEAVGRSAWIVFDEYVSYDERGIRLAYLYLDDGRLVNEELVRKGLAIVDMDQPCHLQRWLGQLTWRATGRRHDLAEAIGIEWTEPEY